MLNILLLINFQKLLFDHQNLKLEKTKLKKKKVFFLQYLFALPKSPTTITLFATKTKET